MNLFELQNREFISRHIGPNRAETLEMLQRVGVDSLQALVEKTIPASIRSPRPLDLGKPESEFSYLNHLQDIASENQVFRSFIGQGYYGTITPSVILRNLFENPGWYTQYTPYQAEIAQGRLESLLNFQTMVSDLTGLPLANASLLDEGTAAAEAMAMLFNQKNKDHEHVTVPRFFVDEHVFPQTKDLLITRAEPIGIELVFGSPSSAKLDGSYFGILVQYPNAAGAVIDYRTFFEKAHAVGAGVVMATDLLALTLLKSPGDLGADVAVGSAQRFGVPLGFGGPHAAFFATKEEYKRSLPGRIIGVSIDAHGNRALRMALQTREQHIKREKATSNICTAQALLANMAAMYSVYHGPKGLRRIAERVAVLTQALAEGLQKLGYRISNVYYFDTLTVEEVNASKIRELAEAELMNFYFSKSKVGISLDETTSSKDVEDILGVFAKAAGKSPIFPDYPEGKRVTGLPMDLERDSDYLQHPVFNSHHSETEMMRYLKFLENKDLSLNTSMISLGSCTMKLNAATELIPVSWPAFSQIHPFAPASQWKGYSVIIRSLEAWLSEITGFAATSLQPNSGAQGEYAGLLTIKGYHRSRGEGHRDVMLIPISAHGTNPASAVMAGMKVVVVKSDEEGHIDVSDLKAKAEQYKSSLAGLMVTYPSTHGVFEESIQEICGIIHDNGGMVYMDGANMNAQVGLTSPGRIGADVCHLNLHKTFAIPHGGGGPGMGPICVTEALKPFLPGHVGGYAGHSPQPGAGQGAVSAAAYGSASILLISYAYIKMLGAEGLSLSTQYAILNANYMMRRLAPFYKILYLGKGGTCAHEFIVDLRPFKASAGIEAEDVAKRLMDYGFHAPTLSFPVPGTIMIEPTESESKAELDRFCDALISIFGEIKAIEDQTSDRVDNPLKNAPHTQAEICKEVWDHPYSRQQAAFPLPYLHHSKFWPSIGRVNNTYGDRNLVCTCEPVSSYVTDPA